MPFTKGQSYEWNEILDGSESVAGPVFYLLHKRGTHIVTAACIDIKWNPRAPYEIWVGEGAEIKRWGDMLDEQADELDVFVRETDERRYFRGRFRRTDSTGSENEISLRMAQVERGPIYKVIFLTEVTRQL